MTSKHIVWIVIALVVVAAAVWYYGAGYPSPLGPTAGQDAATARLGTQETSDDARAIEADIMATDLSGLDQELGDIDAELAQ